MSYFTHISKKKGFAMLFAVLVASVLLSIGLSIFNLTVKELTLSSSGTESQFAFYAADSGAECAIYWDFKGSEIFATSTSSRTPTPSNPDCFDTPGQPVINQYINIVPMTTTSNSAVTVFNLNYSGTTAPCATVYVTKSSLDGVIINTTIDSRGYNTCDTTDPNRVERALRVTY